MPVVVMISMVRQLIALAGELIGQAVGPSVQRRLDDARPLPIGLQPVLPGKPMANLQLLARLRAVLGAEGRSVTRQILTPKPT